ncbi:DMT family transporter [Pseudomonas sp. B2M1-30]|uniref:DMT family transporter n=1 Tax=Pseudomonas koreensis TaxID=198620 RepID=A0A9X3B3Y5_9PSED|nr:MULTISPECIES: DMT family transporter [Pseudomonas]MCU0120114.1 DMT family transporter [Pseudomonas sp. B2M1-30]MCU7249872.1 DMT family transporter [Pseudomonas koreensis]MCU7262125.1 DMT family transporter [Pseudomonas koreensis]
MRRAIVHAGMAGAIWGAVIVIPSLIPDVHPVVISCARFLLYGLFAAALALPRARQLLARLNRRDVLLLLELALTGNVVYFILLSAAVQFAGVAIASLINGLIPVAIMLMGRRSSDGQSGSMLISMAFICAGIAWINLPAIMQIVNGQGNGDKAFGALLALLGVLSWSWFALRNARQMKTLRFSPSEWSTLQGMVTGAVALFITLAVCIFQPQLLPTGLSGERLSVFALTILFLAIGGSWMANGLWNSAAQRLPIAISGQMIVFETLCALLYSYIIARALPSANEAVGILLVLGGVAWTLDAQARRAAQVRRQLAG